MEQHATLFIYCSAFCGIEQTAIPLLVKAFVTHEESIIESSQYFGIKGRLTHAVNSCIYSNEMHLRITFDSYQQYY